MSDMAFTIVQDGTRWRDLLAGFPGADFHHSFEFHEISRVNGEGEPFLLVGEKAGQVRVVWPMLARPIPGSDRRDLGSVYGYPGPLFHHDSDQADDLQTAIAFLKASEFVSVAARLHPVANAPLFVGTAANVSKIGEVIAVDLSRDPADLKREIRGNKNGTIKKIEKAGVTLRHSRDPADTAIFQRIYRETMDRIGATAYYYFSDDYLNALLRAQSFDASYVFAELDGEEIAAASIIKTREYVQYYLSGTANEHMRLSPMSMVLRDQIFEAKDAGYAWFILGGGLGGKDDGLSQFKRGFSKTVLNAGLVKAVLDEAAYTTLSVGKDPASGYFPIYRGQ